MEPKTTDYNYCFKIAIVGDANVGKSTFVYRLITGEFKPDLVHTIGVEYASKKIIVANKIIKFSIWDTAGQERFRSITRSYYRNCVGCILMFDITNRKSFININYWIENIKNEVNIDIEHVLIVGTKADLDSNREVPYDEAFNYAKSQKSEYIELSSKTAGQDIIDQALHKLGTNILEKINSGVIDIDSSKYKNSLSVGNIELNKIYVEYTNSKKCCRSG